MSSPHHQGSGGRRPWSQRRTELVGAVIALLFVAAIGLFVVRAFAPDERLLVLQPEGGAQVDDGDRVRVIGTVRDFEVARRDEAESADDVDGANALAATSIERVGDGVPPSAPDPVALRDEARLEGRRVTVVGEVDQVVGDAFLTLKGASN